MPSNRLSILIDIKSKLGSLDSAKRGFLSLAKNVAVFAAAYLGMRKIITGGREIIKLGADMQHLSQQTAVAVSDLIIIRQVFEDNGVSADNSRLAINKMQKSIIEAGEGLTEPVKAFETMGISLDELKKKSPAEQFVDIGNALAGIEDPAERATAAMRIFGRSGAELLSVFAGGDIDDTIKSLGSLPKVLELNADQLERIDTLLGRLPNKSQQLFAGLADQIGEQLLGPLEDVNNIDLTPLGQKIGAFMGVFIDAFASEELSELIALTIKAGFEQGINFAIASFDVLLEFLSPNGGLWQGALLGLVTFGNEVAKAFLGLTSFLSTTILELSAKPGAILEAGFIKAGEELHDVFGTVINFLIERFESLINALISKTNQLTEAIPGLDGTNIEPIALGRVAPTQARDFDVILEERQRATDEFIKKSIEGVEGVTKFLTDQLDANTAATAEVLGLNKEITDEQGNQITATQQLRDRINERITRLTEEKQIQLDANEDIAASVLGVADANAKVAESLDKNKTLMNELSAKASTEFSTSFKSAFSSIIDGSQSAGSAFSGMISSMLSQLSSLALDSAFSGLGGLFGGGGGGGGGGGFLGGLFGGGGGGGGGGFGSILAGLFHHGGKVGTEGGSRRVSASAFIGAQRFHTGGIAGDEVPAILKRGETVFTPEQMGALKDMGGKSISVNTNIHLNGDGSSDIQSDGQRLSEFEEGMIALILRTLGNEKRPGGILSR